FGWRCMEGTLCTGLTGCTCNDLALTLPIKEESQLDGVTCSIIGGYVYRGCDIPWLNGRYFYSDFCAGYVRSFRYDTTTGMILDERDHTAELAGDLYSIVSFGEDARGEMYIISNDSDVRRIICEPVVVATCGNGELDPGEECDPPNGVNCDCNCETIDGVVLFADDFNSDLGWTESNEGATSGDWDRGIPVNDQAWDFDPLGDADGSGFCWLTWNGFGNTDVDAGAVALLSPTLDMTAGSIVIEYDYFLRLTNTDGATDQLLVEINNADGAEFTPWTPIAAHATDGGLDWRHHVITQVELDAAGVTLTSTMRLRFTVNDADPQSVVEGGLDGFILSTTAGYDDCNANCIADAEDIALGTSFDCNSNGIPDECETGNSVSYPVAIAPPLNIPDGLGVFVGDSFTVPDAGTIEDLDLALGLTHSNNGDITVRLAHNGVSIDLIARPGVPDGSTFGSNNNGFDIVLDDEGSGGPIETFDSGGDIVVSPPNFVPNDPLSAFDGMDMQGVWTITASDAIGQGTGTLDFWELRFTFGNPRLSPCDCNNNGVPDDDDILNLTSQDCNGNGEPDECEIASNPMLDCDGGPTGVIAGGNAIVNTFCFGCHNTDGSGGRKYPGPNIRNKSRLALLAKLTAPTTHPGGTFGFSAQQFADLEAFLADGGSRGRPDGVLDACQVLPDCDDDSINDGCELEKGSQVDLDYDGIPDACEAPCPWDCTPPGGNSMVNIDDIVAVINAIGDPGGPCDVAPDNGDGTFGNGSVNIDDLVSVLNNFGACP
ncbi:MAG: hypothetical protein KC983_01570, partial [Phycisphaerales bacterium]|nr:hypothetical protein [Phycisphaerales bacterium]